LLGISVNFGNQIEQSLTDHSLEMEAVEDVIVDWLLRKSLLSNLEFAHLSNLSKQWRQASKRAILKQISESKSNNGNSSLLLLPSMARFIMTSSIPKVESGSIVNNNDGSQNHDTFCAAWFHPDGIQELPISLNSNHTILSASDDDHSHATSKSGPAFTLNGELTYENSDKDEGDTRSSRSSRKQQIRLEQNRSKSPATLSMSISQRNHNYQNGTALATSSTSTNEPNVPTCIEWRGYRTAMDILSHFGYAASFVEDVISSVQLKHDTSATLGTNEGSNEFQINIGRTKKRLYRDTTYAVRGAIASRPESYCDCIDTDIEKLRTLRFATAGNDELKNIRFQEYKESLLRREIQRRELQRDVLPRIITRIVSSTKNGVVERNGENGAHHHKLLQKEQNLKHRCVQFLNANGGHAVCMLTPPFACGPLIEPVTIFCIGIATEDGCFLSGLHHRFELGHLYPNTEIAEISEQSPVCIATECGSSKSIPGKAIQNNNFDCNVYDADPTTYPVIHTCEDDDDDRDGDEDDYDEDDYDDEADNLQVSNVDLRDDDDDDDDDDDSCDDSCNEDDTPRKCNCIFNGVGEKIAALDEGKPRIIHRGMLGPGMWHCYVAVFDGENSIIRIDGVSESIETETPTTETDISEKTKATLDGLTIGSDHCFGMSLCCGNGSGGEGEGAIAELAVFQGRLDLIDIQVLEQELMEKHCISPIVLPVKELCTVHNQANGTTRDVDYALTLAMWKENEFARQAHALFFLPETEDGTTTLPSSTTPLRIPLRFLAGHRSVAWKQTNLVTGEPIHIKRIGCKLGASSSDL
jgi:hypothetical protein